MTDRNKIYYNDRRRELWVEGQEPAVLRAKSFAVFTKLVEAYPKPVSKRELVKEVWGDKIVSDDSITQAIADVRRALGDKDHSLLHTNPGHGYVLMVPTFSAGPPTSGKDAAQEGRLPVFSIAVTVAAAFALMVTVFWNAIPFNVPNNELDTNEGQKPSIAVLTFDTVGNELSLSEFALGLQSDIIVALGELNTVSVLSPSAIKSDGTKQASLRDFAASGAQFVLVGTIQRSGSRLRVSGNLVDTESSRIVWVKNWDGISNDLSAMQTKVVTALAGELANPWSGRITGHGSDLAGEEVSESDNSRHYIRLGAERFRQYHSSSLREAEVLFRKALEIDARDADAWAGLSFVLGGMIPLTSGDEAKALRDARANAGRQAYHLGDGAGRSLIAGSWTAALRGNRRETLRRLTEGAALLRSDADGLAMTSIQAALTTELYEKAIEWGTQALKLHDQAPAWYNIGPAYAYLFKGDIERSIEYIRQSPESYIPMMALRAGLELQLGNSKEANDIVDRIRKLQFEFSIQDFLVAELFYPNEKIEKLRKLLSETTLKR